MAGFKHPTSIRGGSMYSGVKILKYFDAHYRLVLTGQLAICQKRCQNTYFFRK